MRDPRSGFRLSVAASEIALRPQMGLILSLGRFGVLAAPYTHAEQAPGVGPAKRYRAVAQLVEHRSPKPAVGGSSPSCPAHPGCG